MTNAITPKWLRTLVAAALLLSVVFSISCLSADNTLCEADPDAELILESTLFRDVAFEVLISKQIGTLPAKKFWFAASDSKQVSYGWADILFRSRNPAVALNCDYNTDNPADGCRECSVCNQMCTNGQASVLVAGPHSFADLTELASDGTVRIVSQANSPRDLCYRTEAGQNQFLPQFAADKDGAVYGLTSKTTCGRKTTEWELETNIVSGPRVIRQSLEVYNDVTDAAPRYRFRMPQENGFIRENFSNRLRVKKVRVLLGVRNPQTGAEMILDDPESLRRVRPSRILFLPDSRDGDINRSPTESTNRCYVDPTNDDGGFDLVSSCRRSPGGPHFAQSVTPTFQSGRYVETLDWVIEYKLSDGISALPDFQTTRTTEEFPVIEWTIDQNQ